MTISAQEQKIFERPWGKFKILITAGDYQTKLHTVYPQAKLSLQSHNHRSEHWIVVAGLAKVTKGNEEKTLRKDESIFIPVGCKHRLENIGQENLEVIEVQVGGYLGEDDIIRYEDAYNRQ